ncbi:MAG: hydroxymethylpyrimidine/phosphomethylpyrimidine kinase [Flammeovirgaceae bacterium]|nr:hydroxymethylpyrimidine/phosphomethylpyrimidine kinase [Flammeovirgaceae bacterium]
MENVLSIAGFDPSGGAGLLADIKTIEAHKVRGFGVCTALTFQNESELEGVDWVEIDKVEKQISVLARQHQFPVIKIGLIQFKDMEKLISIINKFQPEAKIIWDPIIKASAGFDFQNDISPKAIFEICKSVFLFTPNWKEMELLSEGQSAIDATEMLSLACKVYLKGGHNPENKGLDYLMEEGKLTEFPAKKMDVPEKHGSGCILSSAIASNLANGIDLEDACRNAKAYTLNYLESDEGLLGWHKNQI